MEAMTTWIRCQDGTLVNLDRMDSVWVASRYSGMVLVIAGQGIGDGSQELTLGSFGFDARSADVEALSRAAFDKASALRDRISARLGAISARLGAWDPMADEGEATR